MSDLAPLVSVIAPLYEFQWFLRAPSSQLLACHFSFFFDSNGNGLPHCLVTMKCSNGATGAPRERISMEMESLHPQPSPISFFQALWALIVAYACYYRGASATVVACVFILLMVVMLDALASHATVHHLTRDYSEIPSLYALKMAQIDHWCLQVRYNTGKYVLAILCTYQISFAVYLQGWRRQLSL